VYDASNTFKELQESKVKIAILPVGSVEQHSLHLPLGTDWIIAKEISQRVAEQLDVYLLPAMPFGTSPCHGGLSGTVWIRPMTLFNFIKDICASLCCEEIKKLAIINCHGGNWVLKPAVREVNLDNPETSVILCTPYLLAQKELEEVFESKGSDDLHAGEIETSCMMYLHHELVKDKKIDYVPKVTQEFLDYLRMKEISSSGVWGKPSRASLKKGKKAIEIMIRVTTKYINETFEKIKKLKNLKREVKNPSTY